MSSDAGATTLTTPGPGRAATSGAFGGADVVVGKSGNSDQSWVGGRSLVAAAAAKAPTPPSTSAAAHAARTRRPLNESSPACRRA